MVYKVSKGGVRSGNTLRGLNSCRTRRYSRHGCVVGRSNLRPKEVPRFLESHIQDTLISASLNATDVALSLNKKKRWLLPATVGHMIKTGRFNDTKTMVSLLERHKLKRRANCVRFVCSQGKINHVVPNQKRYFSFKLDNIDNCQSKRQIKRQNAEKIRQDKLVLPKIKIDQMNKEVKAMEVFTLDGPKTAETRRRLKSSKSEFRLEVFYPCPQTCSLTYNPKYTNVNMEFNEDGQMELQSEKRIVKKGRRYRKRFSLKDLEEYSDVIDSNDTDEFWCDNLDESDDYNTTVDERRISSHHQKNENLIVCLIDQAVKAKSLCDSSKSPQKRTFKKVFDKVKVFSHKSHIIYVETEDPKIETSNKVLETTTTETLNLHSAKVILKSLDASPESLRARFGQFYYEAESEPRRFLIDVSADIQNLVSLYRDTEQRAIYTSFLIFVYDGVYDQGLDVYKVIFNSNCCKQLEHFQSYIAFTETTIEDMINQIACIVLDMKDQNLLESHTDRPHGNASISLHTIANDLFQARVQNFFSCDEIRRASKTEALQENVDISCSLDSVVNNLDYDIFCDICYENINPTQSLDFCGTSLSKCSHIFCDDCWKSHLRARLKDGSVKITCPGYDCDQTVGPVTMLSLLHVSEVSTFFQKKCERDVESSLNSKWCPNQKCGRVIKLDIKKTTSDMSLDVTCSCGQEFCFSCLSNPHWPATCEQAEKYEGKLNALSLKTQSLEDDKAKNNRERLSLPETENKKKFLEIEGRLCTKCSYFVEKYGGCIFVICRCGNHFCWNCLQNAKDHPLRCVATSKSFIGTIIKLKIRHLAVPKNFMLHPEISNRPKLVGSPRQRLVMYKKAMRERQSNESKFGRQIQKIVKQISHVSQKDLHYKKQILSICGLNMDDSEMENLELHPMASHLTKFLRSNYELKCALHHVAEFTFVLLQDVPDSVNRRRAARLANDMSGYCCFIKSLLEVGHKQDMKTVVKRLVDIQAWAKRALAVLLLIVDELKS